MKLDLVIIKVQIVDEYFLYIYFYLSLSLYLYLLALFLLYSFPTLPSIRYFPSPNTIQSFNLQGSSYPLMELFKINKIYLGIRYNKFKFNNGIGVFNLSEKYFSLFIFVIVIATKYWKYKQKMDSLIIIRLSTSYCTYMCM